jgi:hypothetical protein
MPPALNSAPGRPAPALIWINYRLPESIDNFLMTARRRLLIRPCPLCGVAMQASKSREDLADVDTFRCLTCLTTITERKQAPSGDNGAG